MIKYFLKITKYYQPKFMTIIFMRYISKNVISENVMLYHKINIAPFVIVVISRYVVGNFFLLLKCKNYFYKGTEWKKGVMDKIECV